MGFRVLLVFGCLVGGIHCGDDPDFTVHGWLDVFVKGHSLEIHDADVKRGVTRTLDTAYVWPEVAAEIVDRPLPEAHRMVVARAEGVLPWAPTGGLGETS